MLEAIGLETGTVQAFCLGWILRSSTPPRLKISDLKGASLQEITATWRWLTGPDLTRRR